MRLRWCPRWSHLVRRVAGRQEVQSDLEIETEASHLVIVATGRIHNHARVLLHEHSRRRVLAGRDFELILTNEAAAAADYFREAAGHFEGHFIAILGDDEARLCAAAFHADGGELPLRVDHL